MFASLRVQSGPSPAGLVNTAIPAVVFHASPATTGAGSAAFINFEGASAGWLHGRPAQTLFSYPSAPHR